MHQGDSGLFRAKAHQFQRRTCVLRREAKHYGITHIEHALVIWRHADQQWMLTLKTCAIIVTSWRYQERLTGVMQRRTKIGCQ
jgi:hypothetical protein